MTKQQKETLEKKVGELKEQADKAAEAAAGAPDDAALQKAAEQAEETLATAQAELDAAIVDEPKGDNDDEDIDYEEELKRLGNGGTPPAPAPQSQKTEVDKARDSLYHNAKRLKELGGDPSEVLKGLGIEPPATPPAPPAPAPETPPANSLTREDLVEIEFAKIARTEAERKVYLHHYKHSIRPTGNIAEDMKRAILIANGGKITRAFEEMRRAGYSVPNPGKGAPGRPAPAAPQAPQISPAQSQILKRRGFTPQADGTWKGKHYTLKYDAAKKDWVQEKNQK